MHQQSRITSTQSPRSTYVSRRTTPTNQLARHAKQYPASNAPITLHHTHQSSRISSTNHPASYMRPPQTQIMTASRFKQYRRVLTGNLRPPPNKYRFRPKKPPGGYILFFYQHPGWYLVEGCTSRTRAIASLVFFGFCFTTISNSHGAKRRE